MPLFMPRTRRSPPRRSRRKASFTRDFQPDIEVLQRERKADVSRRAHAVAYLTVLAIALALIALIAWVAPAGRPGEARPRAQAGLGRPRAELV